MISIYFLRNFRVRLLLHIAIVTYYLFLYLLFYITLYELLSLSKKDTKVISE